MPVHSLVDEDIACTCVNHCRATYLIKKHFWQHSSSKTIVGLPSSDLIKVHLVKVYKRAIPILKKKVYNRVMLLTIYFHISFVIFCAPFVGVSSIIQLCEDKN